MLCPTDSAKGILKRQHVMSQALSQFASKDLGVPKGEIKKKKKHTRRKQRNYAQSFSILQGALPPATSPTRWTTCNAALLNLFFSPRAAKLLVITRPRHFQARRGYRGHRIAFINTCYKAAQQFPKQAESF